MLPQHVVERLRHQRLQAAALPPGQRVHREGHFGAEEAGDLLAALTAGGPLPPCPRRRRGDRARRDRRGWADGAQIGEAGFAAHAGVLLRADFGFTVDNPICRHVHS